MNVAEIVVSGVGAAVVGALVGVITGYVLQGRRLREESRRMHKAAVVAVLAELEGVTHVVAEMLTHETVMMLPAHDVAYQAMSRELLSALPPTLTQLVVKAYTLFPQLVSAVETAKSMSDDPVLLSAGGKAQGALLGAAAADITAKSADITIATAQLMLYARTLESPDERRRMWNRKAK